MPRVAKKTKSNKKVKSSKRPLVLFFLLLLIPILFVTVLALQQPQPLKQQAQVAGCGAPGDPGNEMGVGKYCTKGGGECAGTGSPYCSIDFSSSGPALCSKPCTTDAECGAGAACVQDTLGKGCSPIACNTTVVPTAAPTAAPTGVTPTGYCLGSCPTVAPTIGLTPTGTGITPTPAPTVDLDTPTEVPNPTEDPCLAGTENVGVQTWDHDNGGGNDGNFMDVILELLKQLIALLQQLLGGNPGQPSNPVPTPAPTGEPEPTVDPCL